MRLRLLRDSRILHHAGEIVEVNDPAAVQHLVSIRSAEIVEGAAIRTPEATAETATKRTATASRKKAK